MIRTSLPMLVAGIAVSGVAPGVAQAQLEVDPDAGSVSLPAVVQAGAFASSTPPDDRYHALVHELGGAAGKSLFVTPVPDIEVATRLRELGAQDGGGVPLTAWSLRWMPLIPQPSSRVSGTPVDVRVEWEGAERAYALHELVADPGGRGAHIHFGGNEEHDDRWPSGCIVCLFSCPGGVLSNASYTIRDHERDETTFGPGDLLPPDGTPVTITITLAP